MNEWMNDFEIGGVYESVMQLFRSPLLHVWSFLRLVTFAWPFDLKIAVFNVKRHH